MQVIIIAAYLEEYVMDDNILKLKLSLEEKTPTLLLGAGFSYGAINENGEDLPLGKNLVEKLDSEANFELLNTFKVLGE